MEKRRRSIVLGPPLGPGRGVLCSLTTAAFLLLSCSNQEESESPASRFTKSDTRFDGIVLVEPAGIVLLPGENAQLSVRAIGIDGMPKSPPAVEFATHDTGTITLFSNGGLDALHEGHAEVWAMLPGAPAEEADVTRGSIDVVADNPPTGPTAVTFESVFTHVRVGESVSLQFKVTDRRGQPDNSSVELQVTPPDLFAIEGTTLKAKAPGMGQVTATYLGKPIAGNLLIAALPTSGAIAGCTPAQPYLLGCQMAKLPIQFARPGLSSVVSVYATRVVPTGCEWKDQNHFEITQESPDTVTVNPAGVIGLGTGALFGKKPGTAKLVAKLDGQVCGNWTASVLLDLEGAWSATCKNGDQGGLQLSVNFPNRDSVFTRTWQSPLDGSGSPTWSPGSTATGSSCFEGQMAFSCEGPASAKATSNAVGLGECGGERHGIKAPDGSTVPTPGVILGADSFVAGACTYKRGGGGCGCTRDWNGLAAQINALTAFGGKCPNGGDGVTIDFTGDPPYCACELGAYFDCRAVPANVVCSPDGFATAPACQGPGDQLAACISGKQ